MEGLETVVLLGVAVLAGPSWLRGCAPRPPCFYWSSAFSLASYRSCGTSSCHLRRCC